jgi:hypothetical protein
LARSWRSWRAWPRMSCGRLIGGYWLAAGGFGLLF